MVVVNTETTFAGRVAVVTGASGGIGAAVARGLAGGGARLVLAGTQAAKMEPLADELRGAGAEVVTHAADLTAAGAPAALAAAALAAMARIDILVNSAGINRPQPAEEVTEEAWDAVHGANLRALFFLSQAVGRQMIAQGYGRIVSVSSQTGTVALPQRAAYCSSKAAVEAVTRSLAYEWAGHGVTVNAVAPTFVETPFITGMMKDAGFRRFVLDNIPVGRMATAEEVAQAVLFLASEGSAMITGTVLRVDGGWTIK